MEKRKELLLFVLVVCLGMGALMFLAWGGLRAYGAIVFHRDCSGYLKRSADANTVPVALRELERALSYVRENDLTDGYTSILYRTPDEDIGFWYENLWGAQEELKTVTAESTALEKSNMLMKLRETLLDASSGGTIVTIPGGISIYPHNTFYAVLLIISLLLMIPTSIILFVRAL